MDLISLAARIYAGLGKDFISHSVRSVRKKFEWPEKEQAIDRCLKEGCEALVPVLEKVDKREQKHLSKLLETFFDDTDTVKELTVLLSGKQLNRDELGHIFEDLVGEKSNVPGFNFSEAIDHFETAFMDRAEQEAELLGILTFGELRKQTKEMGKQSKSQQSMEESLKKIANAKEDEIKRKESSAKTRYLESLAKDCLNLPLSVLGDDTTVDDELTLDAVYVDLDTITGMRVLEAAIKNKRSVLLGGPGSGKSTFVRMLSALLAKANLGEEDYPKEYPKRVSFKLTEQSLKNLESMKLPNKVIDKLKIIKDKEIRDSENFKEKLNSTIGYEQTIRYQSLIFIHAHTETKLLPIFIQLRDLAPKVAALKNIEKLPRDRRNDALIKTVHQQIEENLRRLEAESFTKSLRKALREGDCLLVLDGLDEVPFEQRDLIRQTVSAVISKYSPERVIVTCRVRSYTDNSRLGNFQELTIAALNEEKIKKFITAWYRAKKEAGKVDADQEGKRVDDLQRGALNLMALAKNPMMLTTMAIIHYNKHQLPDERVKLYKLVVQTRSV